MQTIPRAFIPPRHSYFLFGPRGTGKSTLIKKLYPGALKLDFLLPDVERKYLANPERIVEALDARRQNFGQANGSDQLQNNVIIIDEVQRVPKILTAIHAIIENNQGNYSAM